MSGGRSNLWQRDVQRYSLFFALTYFIQGAIDLTSGLANQPVQYLLKDQLHLSAAQTGFFFGVIGVGWTIKPLYGLVSDFLPLGGYQRKSYLLLMSVMGACSWLTLTMFPPQYTTVLLLLTLCAATLAFCDVLIDALMVEVGRPLQLTGRFQAVQWAAISVAFTVAQFAGGYLSAHASPHAVFLLSASFPVVTFVATLGFVQEPKSRLSQDSLRDVYAALRRAGQSRSLWIVAGFLFFWNFSPSLGTPLLYYQADILGFSKIFIGSLGAISNAAGVVGALFFFAYCRAFNLRRLLFTAVALGVASILSFLGLVGPKSAVVIFFIFGMLSQITHLAVLDLAARSCPARAEGTVFALLMSCLNVGRTGSTFLGGWLYDYVGLTPLIFVSAGFTALCCLIVPLLDTKSSH